MTALPQNRLRRRRLTEELTSKLRKHIIDHGLKPGDPLLTEQEMAEQFGVSRTVVREATKALDLLGIIGAAPRRGMFLDHFNFDRVSEYLGFHFALSDYPKEKLLRARAVIETGALFYAMEAMRKSPEVYRRLQKLAEAFPEADHSADAWIDYDIAFHRGLVDASDVTPLGSFCDLLQAFFQKYRDRVASGDRRSGRENHRQIVEFLQTGELDKAVDLLRRHIGWCEKD